MKMMNGKGQEWAKLTGPTLYVKMEKKFMGHFT